MLQTSRVHNRNLYPRGVYVRVQNSCTTSRVDSNLGLDRVQVFSVCFPIAAIAMILCALDATSLKLNFDLISQLRY